MDINKLKKYFVGIDLWDQEEKSIYGLDSEVVKLSLNNENLFGALTEEELVDLIFKIKIIENDKFKFGHSTKFMNYALTIATEIESELKKESGIENILEHIKIASFFHDVGEFFLPFEFSNSVKFNNALLRLHEDHGNLGATILQEYGFDEQIVSLVKKHHPNTKDENPRSKLETIMSLSEIYTGLTSNRKDRERIEDFKTILDVIKEYSIRSKLNSKTCNLFLDIVNQKKDEWPIKYDKERVIDELESLRKQKISILETTNKIFEDKGNIQKNLKNMLYLFNYLNIMGTFAEVSLRSASSDKFILDPEGEYLYRITFVNFKDDNKSKLKIIPKKAKLKDGTIINLTINELMKRKTPMRWVIENKEIQIFTEKRIKEYAEKGLLEEDHFEKVKKLLSDIKKDEIITTMGIPLFYGKEVMGYIRGPPSFPPNQKQLKEIEIIRKSIETAIKNSEELNPLETVKKILKKESNIPENVYINIKPMDLIIREYKDVVVYASDLRGGTQLNLTLNNKIDSEKEVIGIVKDIVGALNNKQRETIITNNGYFNKDEHDGVFAAWGIIPRWNQKLEDKIKYSLDSSFEILEWHKQYQENIKEKYKEYGLELGNLAIGMALGIMFGGVESNMDSWEYKLSGDTIIKAGRLTKKPNFGGLWVNEDFVKAMEKYNLLNDYDVVPLNKEDNLKIQNYGEKEIFYKIKNKK